MKTAKATYTPTQPCYSCEVPACENATGRLRTIYPSLMGTRFAVWVCFDRRECKLRQAQQEAFRRAAYRAT